MPDRTVEQTIALNARLNVAAAAEAFVRRVQAGKTQPVSRANPFHFEGSLAPSTLKKPGQGLANALIERGLHKDAAFLEVLNEGLCSVGDEAMFGFFSGIDGEGHWEGKLRARFCGPEGARLQGDVHGIYHSVNPNEVEEN